MNLKEALDDRRLQFHFSGEGRCQFHGEATDSEQSLMLALSQQHVPFTIEADQFISLIETGVRTTLCGTKLDLLCCAESVYVARADADTAHRQGRS